MTFFDVRIPGLKMTVVQADGSDVEPIAVDEFRIGIAESRLRTRVCVSAGVPARQIDSVEFHRRTRPSDSPSGMPTPPSLELRHRR
jgi:FtsP/CotA-like multicopper oxidase with cupredoxin domain